jgi:hypothetical protein
MSWIKLKNNLINLSNLTRIEINENKVIFYPLFEFEFNSRSDAELVFNTVHAIVANNVHFIDLDKALEKRQIKI